MCHLADASAVSAAILQTPKPPAPVALSAGAAILAFAIASIFTGLELLTTRYRQTYFLLLPPGRCWSLYIYAAIYGVVAAILTLILNTLIASNVLRLEGLGLDNPWVRAVYAGFFTKSLLDFSLFSVGEQRFGFATIVQAFEPTLMRHMVLAEDHWMKVYMAARVKKYMDLDDVRQRIIADIPVSLPEQEKKALELDIREVETVQRAMRLALRQLGRDSFERIFPL